MDDPSLEAFSVWSERGQPRAPTPEDTLLVQGFALETLDFAWQLADGLAKTGLASAGDDIEVRYRYKQQLEALQMVFQGARSHPPAVQRT